MIIINQSLFEFESLKHTWTGETESVASFSPSVRWMNPLGFPFTNLAKICKDAAHSQCIKSNPSRQSKNAGLTLWFYHEVPWRPPSPVENKMHHITCNTSKHTRTVNVSLCCTLPLPVTTMQQSASRFPLPPDQRFQVEVLLQSPNTSKHVKTAESQEDFCGRRNPAFVTLAFTFSFAFSVAFISFFTLLSFTSSITIPLAFLCSFPLKS